MVNETTDEEWVTKALLLGGELRYQSHQLLNNPHDEPWDWYVCPPLHPVMFGTDAYDESTHWFATAKEAFEDFFRYVQHGWDYPKE